MENNSNLRPSKASSEFSSWFGSDANLETSLMEYNLIMRKSILKESLWKYQFLNQNDKVNIGNHAKFKLLHDYQYIYNLGNISPNPASSEVKNAFIFGGIDEAYIDEKFMDLVVNAGKISEFLSFTGCATNWLYSDIVTKINDLVSCFSFQDVFGDYSPYAADEIFEKCPELEFLSDY